MTRRHHRVTPADPQEPRLGKRLLLTALASGRVALYVLAMYAVLLVLKPRSRLGISVSGRVRNIVRIHVA